MELSNSTERLMKVHEIFFWHHYSITISVYLKNAAESSWKVKSEEELVITNSTLANVAISAHSAESSCPTTQPSADTSKAHRKDRVCVWCGKAFNCSAKLSRHIRIHTGERPYRCPDCPQAFTQLETLRVHQWVHEDPKPFQCEDCGRRFQVQRTFEKHRNLHISRKSHACPICGKTFFFSSRYKRHLRIHTGERPFQCQQCGKSFNQRSNYQRHRAVHAGKRPFPCNLCEKSFSQASNYRRHLQTHRKERGRWEEKAEYKYVDLNYFYPMTAAQDELQF
ncbi:unnamed protein product [Ranitomeya imitator]|uniref:C2H2-type domain-containing protein n=1 Tax=Ranitomeya imitator TaxID=111125 RepID=A0ABN9L4F9_9NEOB|nr:unnamed protein product [Ranitomeya imitator]